MFGSTRTRRARPRPAAAAVELAVLLPFLAFIFVVTVDFCRLSYNSVVLHNSQPVSVRARAVARGAWVAPKIGVIVLDYSGKGTLSDQGNGAATESGAPIIVNSNDPSAAMDTGNGTLISPEFDITGGYTISGGGQMLTSPVPNNILTGVHPTPDPLAYLPVASQPPAGTMTKTSLGNGNFQYLLSPGSYSNLPNFNQGDVVIFQQASAGNGGIYWIQGGFTSNGANLIMDPTTTGGMMFYNDPTNGSNSQGFSIAGNATGTVNLSALGDGPYAGMLFWERRDATDAISVTGNGNFSLVGTFYAANANLAVSGNGNAVIGSQYISRTVSFSGGGATLINYSANGTARMRIIQLVE